jgi:hypothetical protein
VLLDDVTGENEVVVVAIELETGKDEEEVVIVEEVDEEAVEEDDDGGTVEVVVESAVEVAAIMVVGMALVDVEEL